MGKTTLRLPIVTEAAATGQTAQIYEAIRARFSVGFVPDVFQLLGSRPRFLRALWEAYQSVFDDGVLPREVKELIAAFVAREAGCSTAQELTPFWRSSPGLPLRSSPPPGLPPPPTCQSMRGCRPSWDWSRSWITPRTALWTRPGPAPRLGWSDAELIEAIWTTCVFNAVVRLVDAFGLTALGQLAVAPAGSDRPGT